MRRANLRSTVRRRARPDPMGAYDRLPAPLRAWLARACLPWDPASARRIWDRALAAAQGDPGAALAALDRAERGTLARDIPRIWGPAHPAAQPSSAARIMGQNRPPERTPNQSSPSTASTLPSSTSR